MEDYSNTTVIIPTLNEESSIGELIGRLLRLYRGINILVMDDGSKDKTKSVVLKFRSSKVNFIDRSSKKAIKGLSASAIDGINLTRTEFFIVMDGDMQHPAEVIKGMVKKMQQGCEIVVAVRGSVENWALYRQIISKLLIYLAFAMLVIRGGARSSDIFSGYFGGKTSVFKNSYKMNKTRHVLRGYKVLYDFLKCFKQDQIRIGEVKYNFMNRHGGKSKAGAQHVIALLKSMAS